MRETKVPIIVRLTVLVLTSRTVLTDDITQFCFSQVGIKIGNLIHS